MHKKSHGLLMLLCCLIPVALVAVFSKLGFGNFWSYGMLLLCPLMHVLMMVGIMRGGHGHKGGCHGDSYSSDYGMEKGRKLKEIEENT